MVPGKSIDMLRQPGDESGSTKAGPSQAPKPAIGQKESKELRDEKMKGIKQLQTLISEVYLAKKVDDQRRDKAFQPRRTLNVVLQEMMRRQHGVKKVVHQKCWQLVEAVSQHAESDPSVRMFSDFLDCSRDLDELSFYLYCSSVLAGSAAEVSLAQSNSLPSGFVSLSRATRMLELLFGDLPKALGVARDDLLKSVRFPEENTLSGLVSSPDLEPDVRVEDLYRVLLEGWRMSALLLDQRVASFSWRNCVVAFIQSDTHHKGWLDPHEVRESETKRLRIGQDNTLVDAEGMRVLDNTSLGAFVFRAVHRCGSAEAKGSVSPIDMSSNGKLASRHLEGGGGSGHRTGLRTMEKKACLQTARSSFESLEKTLGVYLTWLMHSEELRDLAVYHSVKSRIYEFRRAVGSDQAEQGAHQFRCLLLLLLAHQFDMQLQQGVMDSTHLEWELSCLLSLLRHSWKRQKYEDPDEEDDGMYNDFVAAGGLLRDDSD
jgi:hypothetical protein